MHVHSFYGGLGEWKEILLMLPVCVRTRQNITAKTIQLFTCGVFVHCLWNLDPSCLAVRGIVWVCVDTTLPRFVHWMMTQTQYTSLGHLMEVLYNVCMLLGKLINVDVMRWRWRKVKRPAVTGSRTQDTFWSQCSVAEPWQTKSN